MFYCARGPRVPSPWAPRPAALTAVTFGLGFFGSGLMFAAIIAVPAIGYFRFGMNSILAFWFAYVVTRPLGASFADWLAVSSSARGPRPGHRMGKPCIGRSDRRLCCVPVGHSQGRPRRSCCDQPCRNDAPRLIASLGPRTPSPRGSSWTQRVAQSRSTPNVATAITIRRSRSLQ